MLQAICIGEASPVDRDVGTHTADVLTASNSQKRLSGLLQRHVNANSVHVQVDVVAI